jgi:hypothetical protein
MEDFAKTSRLGFSCSKLRDLQRPRNRPQSASVCLLSGQRQDFGCAATEAVPACGGCSGKPEPGNSWCVDYCVICHGTGWIWTEFHLDESSLRCAASALLNSGRIARSTAIGEGEK